jgi:hypothetical protein
MKTSDPILPSSIRRTRDCKVPSTHTVVVGLQKSSSTFAALEEPAEKRLAAPSRKASLRQVSHDAPNRVAYDPSDNSETIKSPTSRAHDSEGLLLSCDDSSSAISEVREYSTPFQNATRCIQEAIELECHAHISTDVLFSWFNIGLQEHFLPAIHHTIDAYPESKAYSQLQSDIAVILKAEFTPSSVFTSPRLFDEPDVSSHILSPKVLEHIIAKIVRERVSDIAKSAASLAKSEVSCEIQSLRQELLERNRKLESAEESSKRSERDLHRQLGFAQEGIRNLQAKLQIQTARNDHGENMQLRHRLLDNPFRQYPDPLALRTLNEHVTSIPTIPPNRLNDNRTVSGGSSNDTLVTYQRSHVQSNNASNTSGETYSLQQPAEVVLCPSGALAPIVDIKSIFHPHDNNPPATAENDLFQRPSPSEPLKRRASDMPLPEESKAKQSKYSHNFTLRRNILRPLPHKRHRQRTR